MIVNINHQESAALTLHMAIMRKSFRNLIKSKYREFKNEYLSSYDYVHEESKKALELFDNGDIENYELNLNIRDLEILKEFLRAYTAKVAIELSNNLQEIDKEQLNALESVQNKCDDLLICLN